jgi:hypothetical protein
MEEVKEGRKEGGKVRSYEGRKAVRKEKRRKGKRKGWKQGRSEDMKEWSQGQIEIFKCGDFHTIQSLYLCHASALKQEFILVFLYIPAMRINTVYFLESKNIPIHTYLQNNMKF